MQAFERLFPRSILCMPAEKNVLSKSSTLTRGMTLLARTAGSYLHTSLSTLREWAGKSMLLIWNKVEQFLTSFCSSRMTQVLLFLDQIKREKGVW